MKTVIACTSAGAGHLKSAEALYNYFRRQDPDSETDLVDVLDESHFLFGNFYSRGYAFMINHCQWLWKFIFSLTSQKNLQPALTKVRTLNNRLNTRNFRQYLIQANPDVIISTHYLPANIACSLKKEAKISSRIVTVVTDFGVHPFWVYDKTDLYAVASDSSRQELLKLGVSAEKILTTGIPVDPKFSADFDRSALRKKIGLDPGRFTVLVVTGSFGIGPIEAIVEALRSSVQLITVCAKNKKLFTKLTAKNHPGVKVFGFVDNIEELMASADIIVTKPGGSSIAEFLSIGLVPVFVSAIPGQEARNASVLAKYGIGEMAAGAEQVKSIVLDYLNFPRKLEAARERIVSLRKPRAAEEIYRALR